MSNKEYIILEPRYRRNCEPSAKQSTQSPSNGLPCWSPSKVGGLGISPLFSPSGVIWYNVPSARPAINCFPRVLHETELTPWYKIWSWGPERNWRDCKFAISTCPFVVTTANNSALSGVGFGTRARKGVPSVESWKADSVLPCIKDWTS